MALGGEAQYIRDLHAALSRAEQILGLLDTHVEDEVADRFTHLRLKELGNILLGVAPSLGDLVQSEILVGVQDNIVD